MRHLIFILFLWSSFNGSEIALQEGEQNITVEK